MSLKLTNTVDNSELYLPPELYWTDEFNWNKVKGNNTPTLTGSLSVQVGVMKAGRPITLTAPSDMAWCTRLQLEKLYEWAQLPTLKMKLTLAYEGVPVRVLDVAFNHTENPVDATPVNGYESPLPTDEFIVTLKLMEIEA